VALKFYAGEFIKQTARDLTFFYKSVTFTYAMENTSIILHFVEA